MTPSYPSSGASAQTQLPPTPGELRGQQLQAQQAQLNQKQAAIQELMNKCTSFGTGLISLEGPSLFNRKMEVHPEGIISATAGGGALPRTYTIEIKQLATSSILNGASSIFQSLGENPSAIRLSSIPALEKLTEGFCIVQGKKIPVSREDSLEDWINRIQTETTVEVTYKPLDSTLELKSSDNAPLRLGSPGDSSNLLKLLGLFGKGGVETLSTAPLIGLDFKKPLNALALITPLAPQGKFCVNGIDIVYDASEDTPQGLIDKLQNSEAHVLLSYDRTAKAFKLENKIPGGLDIFIEDLEGNFLEALGLRSGSLSLGQTSTIVIEGQTHTAASTKIEPVDHGIEDLCIQTLDLGTCKLTVSVDLQGPKEKIENQLIKPFNEIQTFIQAKAAYVTQGEKRIPGPLGDGDFTRFGDTLRRKLSGLDGGILEGIGSLIYIHQIGISFTDKTLSLKDPISFEDQLKIKPQDVQKLLNGLAKSLRTYLESHVQVPKDGKPAGWLYTKKEAVSKALKDLQVEIDKTKQSIFVENNKRKQEAAIVAANQRKMQQGSMLYQRTF